MCDVWQSDFNAFMSDMGPRPNETYSLDRINPNGNYEPSNCRWTTIDIQSKNKRNTKLYNYNGEILILREVADRIGLSRDQAKALLRRGKLPVIIVTG